MLTMKSTIWQPSRPLFTIVHHRQRQKCFLNKGRKLEIHGGCVSLCGAAILHSMRALGWRSWVVHAAKLKGLTPKIEKKTVLQLKKRSCTKKKQSWCIYLQKQKVGWCA
jgi:hypothetical protein